MTIGNLLNSIPIASYAMIGITCIVLSYVTLMDDDASKQNTPSNTASTPTPTPAELPAPAPSPTPANSTPTVGGRSRRRKKMSHKKTKSSKG
jgi:hypothetical protein